MVNAIVNGFEYEYWRGISTDWSIVSYYKVPKERQFLIKGTESVVTSVKVTVDKRAENVKFIHEILLLNQNGVACPRVNCKENLLEYDAIINDIEKLFNFKEA